MCDIGGVRRVVVLEPLPAYPACEPVPVSISAPLSPATAGCEAVAVDRRPVVVIA